MGTEKKTGASLARHKSIQERGTPRDFIEAVEFRFGNITIDLAANKKNAVVPLWFGPGSQVEKDSLLADWSMLTGTLWLNPPFGTIAPWTAKLARECKSRSGFTPLLVPAAVGSNWFQQHVVPNSVVLELTDRITFVGETQPYPKDLLLCVFGYGLVGRSAWHWDASKTKTWERIPKPKPEPKPKRIAKSVLAKALEAGFEPAGNGLWMPVKPVDAQLNDP